MTVEMVSLMWRRDHHFKAKDPSAKIKFCEVCGSGLNHASLIHYGAPSSVNFGGSGFEFNSYQGIKQSWQKMWVEQLIKSGLSRYVCQRIVVEAEVGFDIYNSRD